MRLMCRRGSSAKGPGQLDDRVRANGAQIPAKIRVCKSWNRLVRSIARSKRGSRDVSESADTGRLRPNYGDRCTFACLSEHRRRQPVGRNAPSIRPLIIHSLDLLKSAG